MGSSKSKPKASFDAETHDNRLADKYQPAVVPEATQLGYNHPNRGCTDPICIIVFGLAWTLMWILAVMAFQNGDPKRLLYGRDVAGNLCGQHDPPAGVNESAWGQMKNIVYPFPSAAQCGAASLGVSGPTCETLVKDALKRGICVDDCPGKSDVKWYDGSDTYKDNNGTELHVSFSNQLDLKETVHRCVPESASDLANASVALLEELDIAGTLSGVVRQLEDSWEVCLICCVACVFICFLWLFILRCTVKPTVFATLLVLWVLLGFLSYFLYTNYDRTPSDNTKSRNTWLFFAILTAASFVIYSFLLCFFCKNINVACDVIEEASKIPLKIKCMAIVPPLVTLCLIPMIVWHGAVAVYIQTSGNMANDTVPVLNSTAAQSHSATATVSNATEQLIVSALSTENWKDYAHLVNLFMFLWSIGVVQTAGYLTLAFCAVFWYWSKPGDHKDPPAGVARGFCYVLRYHLGTIIFGSFIIATIQLIRFLMQRFEDRMRKIADNQLANCLIKCVQCLLACFERLIKFINKNAYIMTAMCSDSFCGGARRALFLLLRHAFSVMAVNFIGDWVIFFGKLQIVCLTTALGWLMLTQTDISGDYATEDSILTLVIIAVVAYAISSIFCEVFGVCVDTVLLSFCHDLDVNNGMDKPYYLPSDLQRSLGHKNKGVEMAKELQKPFLGGDKLA